MEKSLIIIGAGKFAVQAEEIAHLCGYDEVVFVDDNPDKALCSPVVGTTDDLSKLRRTYNNAIVCMGINEDRLRLHKVLEELDYNISVLIHPTAYVSPEATLGAGTIIREMCVVGRFASLGKAVLLNMGAKVDHHCVIGDGCHMAPNSVVRKSQCLEECRLLGTGEVVEI